MMIGLCLTRRLTSLLVGFVLWVPAAHGQEHPCHVDDGISGYVEAIDARLQTLVLKADAAQYFVANITVPSGGKSPFELMQMRPGQFVSIHAVQGMEDRYGRRPASVWLRNEMGVHVWVQGDLLRRGLAILDGLRGSVLEQCSNALAAAEGEAREAKRGYWSRADSILSAGDVEKLAQRSGLFTIIEGVVKSVGDREKRLYLNFGEKWSEDFTISVVKRGRGAFKGDIKRLTNLKGTLVRVRGVLDNSRGPLIRMADEKQIEILE